MEGRLWGPDLFAWAYDDLDRSQAWRNQAAPEQLEHDIRVIQWRGQIRAALGWIPDELLSAIRADVDQHPHPPAALLNLVVAIDRAYTGLRLNNPGVATAPAVLGDLLRCWERQHSLERAASGKVLRKGSRWKVGSALSHYCNELCRVPASLSDRVHVTRSVPAASLGDLIRENGPDPSATVAFIPALEAGRDLDFVAISRGRGKYFAARPAPKRQAELGNGMDTLVRDLEAERINIAFFPETAAVDDTVDKLKTALIDNNARQLHAGELPALRLAIVGVAGHRRNDAVVLGADGRSLATQPKNNRWRLDLGQLKRYGLTVLGNEDRYEDIEEGSVVSFIDDPGFGRTAILICEDLARGETAFRLTTAATPTAIFSPICDGALSETRWAYRAAMRIAEEPGALVFVANSLTLIDREEHELHGKSATSAGIGIVMHPSDFTQSGIVDGRPGGSPSFFQRTVRWPEVWELA